METLKIEFETREDLMEFGYWLITRGLYGECGYHYWIGRWEELKEKKIEGNHKDSRAVEFDFHASNNVFLGDLTIRTRRYSDEEMKELIEDYKEGIYQ